MGFVWLKFWWIMIVEEISENDSATVSAMSANVVIFFCCWLADVLLLQEIAFQRFYLSCSKPFNGCSSVYRWDEILLWLMSCSIYCSSDLAPDDFVPWIFAEDGEDLTFLRAFFLFLMVSLHVSLNQIVLCFRTDNLLFGTWLLICNFMSLKIITNTAIRYVAYVSNHYSTAPTISWNRFYRRDALSVTQPRVSKHCRNKKWERQLTYELCFEEQITHGNLQVSIFHHTEAAASQLLITFQPDNVRFWRSKHLAREVDSLTFGSSETNDRSLLDERRLSYSNNHHSVSQCGLPVMSQILANNPTGSSAVYHDSHCNNTAFSMDCTPSLHCLEWIRPTPSSMNDND